MYNVGRIIMFITKHYIPLLIGWSSSATSCWIIKSSDIKFSKHLQDKVLVLNLQSIYKDRYYKSSGFVSDGRFIYPSITWPQREIVHLGWHYGIVRHRYFCGLIRWQHSWDCRMSNHRRRTFSVSLASLRSAVEYPLVSRGPLVARPVSKVEYISNVYSSTTVQVTFRCTKSASYGIPVERCKGLDPMPLPSLRFYSQSALPSLPFRHCFCQTCARFRSIVCPVSIRRVSCFDQTCVLFRSDVCPVSIRRVSCFDQTCVLFRSDVCPVSIRRVSCFDQTCVLFRSDVCPVFRQVLVCNENTQLSLLR